MAAEQWVDCRCASRPPSRPTPSLPCLRPAMEPEPSTSLIAEADKSSDRDLQLLQSSSTASSTSPALLFYRPPPTSSLVPALRPRVDDEEAVIRIGEAYQAVLPPLAPPLPPTSTVDCTGPFLIPRSSSSSPAPPFFVSRVSSSVCCVGQQATTLVVIQCGSPRASSRAKRVSAHVAIILMQPSLPHPPHP